MAREGWQYFEKAILALKKKGVIPEKYDTSKDAALRQSVMFWWKERYTGSLGEKTAEENIQWVLKNPPIGGNGENPEK
jgi:hypothetical protein